MKRYAGIQIALILCAALCFGVTACSAGDGRFSDLNGAPGSGAAQAKTDNTLVFAGENVDTINPILDSHGQLPAIVFSGLMKYDANGRPVADLAENCVYDDKTLTYTFHLKKGVKWHDGKPFTSADVVFTYRELTEDKTLSSSVLSEFEDIKDVKAPDDFTVVITLSKYNAAMPGYFCMGIVPRHLLEGKDMNTDPFNQHPVGTGRYQFVSWDKAGGVISFKRNEDYYDKVPGIEKLAYKTVATESTKALMLENGEADLAWLNAKYADRFRGNDKFRNYDFTTADYRSVEMDFKTDFWKKNKDSVGVLNYAVDKEAILKSILAGRGKIAYSPIQLNAFGGGKQADLYRYDLKTFAREMEKLGWKKDSDGIYGRNGQKFRFTIQVRDYEEERVDIANIVSKQLQAAGVDMRIQLVTKFDWKTGYNGFLAGYASEFDPDSMYQQLTTNGSDNTMQYSNAEVDRLLTEARHTKETEKRKALYGKFESAYAAEPSGVLIAYLDGNYVGIHGLQGLDTTRVLGHHAVGVMWNIEDWKLQK